MVKHVVPAVALALAFVCPASAQVSNTLYKRGDSCVAKKDFLSAAAFYSGGLRAEPNTMFPWGNRYTYTASLWAKAGKADSAFAYMDLAAKHASTGRGDVYLAETGTYMDGLRADKRWMPALKQLKERAAANGYPQTEHVYGRKDGVALTLVEVKPKVRSIGKAIIYVNSGSWFSNYNGIEMNTYVFRQYLDAGYTVFAVTHGSNPRYAIPDAIADIKRSVRFIRYRAAEFGIDPQRIGITGGSAGGHLSLSVALADERTDPESADPVERVSARVQAVAVLYPPTDVMNWAAPGMNLVNAFGMQKMNKVYGALDFRIWNKDTYTYDVVTDTAARNRIGFEMSPYNLVSSDDPPVFIIHGDSDRTVPIYQSRIMVDAFNKAGVQNRLIVKKGGDHRVEDMMPEYGEFVGWFNQWLK